MPVTLTEKAASAVKRIIAQQDDPNGAAPQEKIHLRVRLVGAGCSGWQHKLGLDPTVSRKLDEVFEMHGVPVVIDKRSLLYLADIVVDYHDELNRSGFSVANPNQKSTCGCGSSFSM